jgi:hypothetical protein
MRTLLAFLLLGSPVLAAEPDTAAFAKLLREMLVKKIPAPALESRQNWGQQKLVTVGMDVKRRGPLEWERTPIKALRNDGQWSHMVVTLPDPKTNLAVEIQKLEAAAGGKSEFRLVVRTDHVNLTIEQQNWKNGVRLFSNETRATCRAAIRLDGDITNRTEFKPGSTLPQIVMKLNVTNAELFYDKLTVEHTLGVGGDAAKIIGDATQKLVKTFKPNLEKDLLEKANAAILKAMDEKELRVGLEGLIKK